MRHGANFDAKEAESVMPDRDEDSARSG